MGFMKFLLIVAVVIIGIAYFFPDTYEEGKAWVFDKFKTGAKDKIINTLEDNTEEDQETQTYTEESGNESSDTQDEVVEEVDRVVTEDTNACGYVNFALPDYEGTSKEGETCTDTFSWEQNNECLANPPAGYDGTILLLEGYSSPKLTCCKEDGTCQWEE